VIFELPWVLAVQRYGANLVLAIAIVGWSAATIGTGFCHNYGQLVACRLLLGFLEAGLFPALTFLLSTTYPRNSQGKRVAALYGATAISGAFGGLIAYGIQLMGARRGLEAWRWLFIIEGGISLFLGLVAMLTLPKSASSAWFLTKLETELIEQRLKRDVAYAGEDHGFSISYIWMTLNDVVVWVSALSIFCAGIPLFGFGIFLPTIIRGMGCVSICLTALSLSLY
jgi:MFS family permease